MTPPNIREFASMIEYRLALFQFYEGCALIAYSNSRQSLPDIAITVFNLAQEMMNLHEAHNPIVDMKFYFDHLREERARDKKSLRREMSKPEGKKNIRSWQWLKKSRRL